MDQLLRDYINNSNVVARWWAFDSLPEKTLKSIDPQGDISSEFINEIQSDFDRFLSDARLNNSYAMEQFEEVEDEDILEIMTLMAGILSESD